MSRTRRTLGKNYTLVRLDLSGFKTNYHIIFFRIISVREIEIIRILYEEMGLKSEP